MQPAIVIEVNCKRCDRSFPVGTRPVPDLCPTCVLEREIEVLRAQLNVLRVSTN